MPRRQRRRRLSAASLNTSFNADAITPARQSSVEPSDLEVSFIDLGENDDNAERSQARKGRGRRKSIAGLITPVRSARRPGSVRSRRGSASPFGSGSGVRRKQYTNDQLTQIYKDCIIKAQTGKITQQNAWNLHLVDNIKEITVLHTNNNKENNGNSNNRNHANKAINANFEEFARASHTIDAASKIYGYRVDSVHSKTYNVLSRIHQQTGDDNNDGLIGDDAENERKRKRQQRNRNVGRSTLCEQDKLYKLNETLKNLCVEVDPLFHKTASCFDEGGAKGLLMNTLYVQNGCDIVFDSSTKIEQNENITTEGVKIDNDKIENEQEIEKETEWMTQLFTDAFGKEVVDIDNGNDGAFDGFTQIDTTSPDFDVSTQTKPQNFIVDMEWIENCSVCPLLNVFEGNIDNISKHLPNDDDDDANNQSKVSEDRSPEKDLNNANMFANDDGGFGDDDDDVLMDMPDFTIGNDDNLNAQDLFHEELLTQAVAPRGNQPSLLLVNNGMGIGDVSNIQLQLDPNGIPINDQNIEYVPGENNNSNIIGDMGVQPLLNNSMHFHMNNDTILNNLQLEQEQHGQIHRRGIFQAGVMNLVEMDQVVSKLENADFESVTTFFDAKKQGNWAGPDQWYHRRYQLTLQQNITNKARSKSPSKRASRQQSADGSGTVSPNNENKKRKRGERKNTKFDFLSIAQGNLIDTEEFAEPQRADNCLTEAVLNKNRKTYHTLPKDLQIKPDIFIKLFHRPNYSVWKHWRNQHAIRMRKIREDAVIQQQQQNGDGDAVMNNNNQEGLDGMAFLPSDGMGDDDVYQMNMSMMNYQQQEAAHNAVVDPNDKDFDETPFEVVNPLDSSSFIRAKTEEQNYYDFNLSGYDMVEMDPSKKLEKIKVEFATTAKKVNVRKLKGKLWEKIHTDLPERESSQDWNKENDANKSNKNGDDDDDNDIDMENNGDDNNNGDIEIKENDLGMVTFQDTLNTLPSTISSSISISMCFICLLHLANEKELQFVPNSENRGNFEIQYASENSTFEKEARKINPIVVLGME